MAQGRILIYGATGYTGRLVAAEATRRRLDVVLAGRSPEKLKGVAEPLCQEVRALSLKDAARLQAGLDDIDVVLHIAGPFSRTAQPMVDACLATGTHYLDVTGEIDVFEALARRDGEAREAGVVLLPGVGFDVVPSDCLAAHVAARVEDPIALRLAIAGVDRVVSRGTAKTSIEALGEGLRIRRDGILRRLPAGSLERHFDFGAGPARALAMPLGDVAASFHSTGIPNIEAYVVASGRIPRGLRLSRLAGPLLRRTFVQQWLQRRVDDLPEGPDEASREAGRALVIAEVEGIGGEVARALLETPSPYALTPVAAIEAARRVAEGSVDPGYHTPATAFGADFVLDLAGCRRTDLSPT